MARRKRDGEIRVTVVDYGREFLMLRYKDPLTGKYVSRSAETSNRKQAEKEAAKWEADLQEGRYKAPSKVTWEEFRQRYEDEVLPGLAAKTATKASSTFNAVEKHLGVERLGMLNAEKVSYLQSKLRESGLSESTIKGHMAHLLAALNWAKTVGMIHDVPAVRMPHRAKRSTKASPMKGRPITTEEFERMLEAVPKALFPEPKKKPAQPKRRSAAEAAAIKRHRAEVVESWRHLLRGLWWTGLRLGEALELWWDRDDKLTVDLSGKRPMLRIPAALEKGNRDRLLPLTPDAAEFLLATPETERTGPVFNPLPAVTSGGRPGMFWVSKIVSRIGAKAKVKVASVKPATDTTPEKVKHASAHDLRRSFGERWAVRVMPQVLKELMRHESIETTMRYYVGRNAETTADAVWAAFQGDSGNTLGNNGQSADSKAEQTCNASCDTVESNNFLRP